MITARADVVGSLLRPPELLEARRRLAEGGISAPEFKRVEDRAVDWAISLQERAGLPVVTDGEMRRESFQSQMVEAVEGFGEQGSRWLVSGTYEPLARRIFERIHAERLMLEYDDERSGGFEPLAHVSDDKIAVLGLVTTKSPQRETPEWLEARLREASHFVPLERLAPSSRCGFATSVIGNAISVEDEERKLRTIVESAERVWD